MLRVITGRGNAGLTALRHCGGMVARALLLVFLVCTAGSAAAETACDPTPQSYVFIKPPAPAGQGASGRPIVVGSQNACAEIVDPKADLLGPITVEVAPRIGRPRPERPIGGPEPLTNAPSPD
ncbi:MAG: hypothetical protein ACOVOI_02755 [Hyphomicrobiales bacterium]